MRQTDKDGVFFSPLVGLPSPGLLWFPTRLLVSSTVDPFPAFWLVFAFLFLFPWLCPPWECPWPPPAWPWNMQRPSRFTRSPTAPTVATNTGESISRGSVKRSIASRTMVKQSAVRKTAFTRAPITSARIQPNVFLLVARVFSAKRTATRATTRAITSDSIWKESDSMDKDEVIRLTTTSTMK